MFLNNSVDLLALDESFPYPQPDEHFENYNPWFHLNQVKTFSGGSAHTFFGYA